MIAQHILFINKYQELWGMGRNASGQLGDGTTTNKLIPTRIGTDTDWKQVAVGEFHTVAIKNDGSLWAWGYNANGQVGDGTTANKNTPTRIGTDTDWKQVAAGSNHTVAIKNNGSLWAWGHNNYGQVGDGTTATRTTPTRIGADTDWKQVIIAGSTSYGIKLTLDLYGWGYNNVGQLGDGTTNNRLTPIKISITDPIGVSIQKIFPTNVPTNLIVACRSLDLYKLILKVQIPSQTGMRFLFSTDKTNWKSYNLTTRSWEVVSLENIRNQGMTKEQVESLNEIDLAPYRNVPFYIAVCMWTENQNETPVFRGIDGYIDAYTNTPSIQSISAECELLKSEQPKLYVSRDDGATWKEIRPDTLTQLDDLPEGTKLRVKAVLSNGQELHGLSYSWV